MICPTRKAVLWLSGLLPAPWLLVTYRPELWRWSFLLSLLLLSAIGVDGVLARPRRRIDLQVVTPEVAHIGDAIDGTMVVRCADGTLPARYQLTLDVSGDARPHLPYGAGFAGAEGGTNLVRIIPRQRGMVHLETAWIRWRGPMQLIEEIRRFPIARQISVVPNIQTPRADALALYFRDALFGAKAQRTMGDGSEFESLREYTPGLDSRFIDWKRSARHRRMLVREFRTERNHPIVLAFDTGYLMYEPLQGIPRLDHAIGAGLLLARVALSAGDLVSSCAFDSRVRHYLPPARGIGAFRRIQQASATMAYSHEETNFTLGIAELQTRLPRRSLIVLFTDFVDTITAELLVENIRRLTSRHLIVFVTLSDGLLKDVFEGFPGDARQIARAVLADEFRKDRGVVLEKLERMGIHCLDVPADRLSVALLNRYLLIKQRGLL